VANKEAAIAKDKLTKEESSKKLKAKQENFSSRHLLFSVLALLVLCALGLLVQIQRLNAELTQAHQQAQQKFSLQNFWQKKGMLLTRGGTGASVGFACAATALSCAKLQGFALSAALFAKTLATVGTLAAPGGSLLLMNPITAGTLGIAALLGGVGGASGVAFY